MNSRFLPSPLSSIASARGSTARSAAPSALTLADRLAPAMPRKSRSASAAASRDGSAPGVAAGSAAPPPPPPSAPSPSRRRCLRSSPSTSETSSSGLNGLGRYPFAPASSPFSRSAVMDLAVRSITGTSASEPGQSWRGPSARADGPRRSTHSCILSRYSVAMSEGVVIRRWGAAVLRMMASRSSRSSGPE